MEQQPKPQIPEQPESRMDTIKAFAGFLAAGGFCGGKAAAILESGQASTNNVISLCLYGSFALGATVGATHQWKVLFKN